MFHQEFWTQSVPLAYLQANSIFVISLDYKSNFSGSGMNCVSLNLGSSNLVFTIHFCSQGLKKI